MLRQYWDDASDTALIEHNGVAQEWGCNPFWSGSTVFNQSSIAIIIAVLTFTLTVKGP